MSAATWCALGGVLVGSVVGNCLMLWPRRTLLVLLAVAAVAGLVNVAFLLALWWFGAP